MISNRGTEVRTFIEMYKSAFCSRQELLDLCKDRYEHYYNSEEEYEEHLGSEFTKYADLIDADLNGKIT